MSANSSTGVYSGGKRKLVLAFDVGTTYSGVSYSILDPGQCPEIKGVTRFPAFEQVNGASKIPTVMFYNREGKMVAAGAEALQEGIFETSRDEEWIKTEWFKLHIRSKRGTNVQLEHMLPPLPPNKTVVAVLADFIQYLQKCAKDYIQDTHVNGRELWEALENDIDYVITHPNGWEGYQQGQIYDAVVLAGLIPKGEVAKGRITFLTEGEASLHYAVNHGLSPKSLKNGEGVIIVDAGGGTIDVSAYRKTKDSDDGRFEEISIPQCHFYGSVFVSIGAKIFISNLLQESTFIDDLDHIVQRFDQTTKLRFKSDSDPQFIRFGGNRDNDEDFGIRYGQLKLAGKDVAGFFAPSVNCIVKAVREAVEKAHGPISHVVLVGGFASSDWLYSEVSKQLTDHNLSVMRPETHLNKAVSDGALAFYLSSQVKTRITRFAYGELCNPRFKPEDPEHKAKEHLTYHSKSTGQRKLRDRFYMMIPKNHRVKEGKEYRKTFPQPVATLEELKSVSMEIWCYRGDKPKHCWKDEEPEMFARLCRIYNDLRNCNPRKLEKHDGTGDYYEVDLTLIFFFEGIELKAQVAWDENGVEKRSPAKVVYDPTD